MKDIVKADREYKGKQRFDRAQIEYVAWCILAGVVDLVEGGLPTSIDYKERAKRLGEDRYIDLSGYERGALEAAGWSLSIFFAQLTGEGMGVGDALAVADSFHEAIERLVAKAWQNQGEDVKAAIRLRDGSYNLADVLPQWPDCHKHARHFADAVLQAMDDADADDDTHTFSDGSYLEPPTSEAPEIRRRDEQGNFLDVREPEDEGYKEWADLFHFTPPGEKHQGIPDDWPVRPLKPDENPPGKTTCGYCGLSWDDSLPTSMTPAPAARCPFEQFHLDVDDEE